MFILAINKAQILERAETLHRVHLHRQGSLRPLSLDDARERHRIQTLALPANQILEARVRRDQYQHLRQLVQYVDLGVGQGPEEVRCVVGVRAVDCLDVKYIVAEVCVVD